MVIYNAATRELSAKIVYYGPGLGGKTTNLHLLHERLEPATVGKLLNLATQTDRTIYFDLLPVELGDIKGYKIRFQLATVPGQTAFNETRRVVLKGTDGIVFVADSQWTALPKNLESWQNLKDNLKANGVSFEGIPIVVQYNKRDLTDILSVDALQEALGLSSYPFVEAVASAGRGVTETFKLISKLTFVDLLRRLQGRKPDEAGPARVRREPDDLLSWKDSLLARGPAPAGQSPAPREDRPHAFVPTFSEEAPFDTGEAASESGAEPGLPEADAPFAFGGQASASPTPKVTKPTPAAARESATTAAHPTVPSPARPSAAESRGHLQPPPQPSRKPVAEAGAPRSAAPPAVTEERVRVFEAKLEEALGQLARDSGDRERAREEGEKLSARLEELERDSRALGKSLAEKQQSLAERLEEVARETRDRGGEAETKIGAIQERLAAAEKRQRTSEDDVSMALASFGERGEKVQQQLAAIGLELKALEAALQEKTGQSRREADDIRSEIESLRGSIEEKIGNSGREAEDIRTQIGPLLEAHGQRGASEDRLSQEFDRLRESIAESLGDLSERLRRAVRGA
jgi:mutual gliding-motility protein MglA